MYQIGNRDRKTFDGGLAIGANFTQVDGDSYAGYHKLGLQAGLFSYAHFSDKIGASMELLYTQKGSNAVTTANSVTVGTYFLTYLLRLNYVEVPVAFHYIVLDKYDLEAGLSAAYLVRTYESMAADYPVYIDEDRNRFEKVDVDWFVGVTKKLYMNLFINMRYQYSFTTIRPITRIPYGSFNEIGDEHNNVVTARFLYVF